MLASAHFDGIAEALVGAAVLFGAVLLSVPNALVHAGLTIFEIDGKALGRVGTVWLVLGVPMAFSVLMLAGGADELLVPFLPVVFLAPFILGIAARHTSGTLAAKQAPGSIEVWINRVAPLAWLAILGYFVIVVAPRM